MDAWPYNLAIFYILGNILALFLWAMNIEGRDMGEFKFAYIIGSISV